MNRIPASLLALLAVLLFCRASTANRHFTPYLLMEHDGSREPADADRLIAVNGTLFFRAEVVLSMKLFGRATEQAEGTVRGP